MSCLSARNETWKNRVGIVAEFVVYTYLQILIGKDMKPSLLQSVVLIGGETGFYSLGWKRRKKWQVTAGKPSPY